LLEIESSTIASKVEHINPPTTLPVATEKMDEILTVTKEAAEIMDEILAILCPGIYFN